MSVESIRALQIRYSHQVIHDFKTKRWRHTFDIVWSESDHLGRLLKLSTARKCCVLEDALIPCPFSFWRASDVWSADQIVTTSAWQTDRLCERSVCRNVGCSAFQARQINSETCRKVNIICCEFFLQQKWNSISDIFRHAIDDAMGWNLVWISATLCFQIDGWWSCRACSSWIGLNSAMSLLYGTHSILSIPNFKVQSSCEDTWSIVQLFHYCQRSSFPTVSWRSWQRRRWLLWRCRGARCGRICDAEVMISNAQLLDVQRSITKHNDKRQKTKKHQQYCTTVHSRAFGQAEHERTKKFLYGDWKTSR